MIINQEGGPVIPDKTIAMFPFNADKNLLPFDIKNTKLFLKPLKDNYKRDWFDTNFYKCLPLAIGNIQGFIFSFPYKLDIIWNGDNSKDGIKIFYYDDFNEYKDKNFISISSHFGHGILTINFPITLKTPPGINLMTISPPNFPLPGLSPMTGVVESDNLRFAFTLNIKIDIPNTLIKILPNSPLIGIIPIPRYFCDSFELKNAYDIFEKNIVDEEIKTIYLHGEKRVFNNQNNNIQDSLYYQGKDILGNKFEDHQLPKKYKS